VAVDSSGNTYIADTANNRIREVFLNGTIITFAGNGTGGYSGDGGPATSAELNYPTGVAVDSSGNVFIADTNNNRIREVFTNGTIVTYAGSGYYGTGGFSGDGGPATSAQLNYPSGVAFDSSGNLYIADSSNNRIRKVSPSGTIITFAGNGTGGYSGDGGPATSAELKFPFGVAVDLSGNVFIADSLNNVIREVFTNGTIVTFAGNGANGYSGDGGPATSAQLRVPYGVAVDSFNNVFIVDTNNQRIRKVWNGVCGTLSLPVGAINLGTTFPVIFRVPPSATTNAPFSILFKVLVNGNIVDSLSGVCGVTYPSSCNFILSVGLTGSSATVQATVTPPGVAACSMVQSTFGINEILPQISIDTPVFPLLTTSQLSVTGTFFDAGFLDYNPAYGGGAFSVSATLNSTQVSCSYQASVNIPLPNTGKTGQSSFGYSCSAFTTLNAGVNYLTVKVKKFNGDYNTANMTIVVSNAPSSSNGFPVPIF